MTMGSGDQHHDGEHLGGQPSQPSAMAPPGWYPIDGGGQRYWDGSAWTEHVAPGPAVTPPAPPATPDLPGVPTASSPDPQPFAQPPGPQPLSGAPGAGFPPGVGDPQPVWGAAPGVPYGQHQPVPPMYAQDSVAPSTPDDRSMALLCHVLGIFTGFLGPLIVWIIKKDQSRFMDHHGKQALNFQFSMLLYWMVTFFSIFILVGLFFLPVLFLLGIFTGFLGPLIVWVIKKDQSRFMDYHGKQALNFQFSMLIYWMVAVFSVFLLVGLFLLPVLFLLGIILPIVAAVAANRGEMYRYPLTINFFR